MLSKRMAVAALTLFSTFTFSLFAAEEKPAAAASDKAPRLTLVDPLKDFGTVAKGQMLDWSFTVKNTGDADLQILSANPTCGCTVAEFDKVIKPGQTGKVSAHVDTTAFSGPISKAVTLSTNDPNTPSAQLSIHAVVRPYVEAFPAGFVRFNVLQGESATQSLKFYSEEEQPFEITRFEVPSENVKVNIRKIESAEERVEAGRAGQNQYAVDFVYTGGAKVGPIAEKVKLFTNSKLQPEYNVSVTGVVRPTYSVIPTALNFGEVVVGDDASTREISVRSNNKTDTSAFKVTKVESTVPAVSAELAPSTTAGEYTVKLKVAKGAKAGDLDGAVKIYTSDKLNPVVTVPVKATVKAAVKPAA